MLRSALVSLLVLALFLLFAVAAAGQGVLGKRYIGAGYDTYWAAGESRQGGTAGLNVPLTATLDSSLGYSFVAEREGQGSSFSSISAGLTAHGSTANAGNTPYVSVSVAHGISEYNADLAAGFAVGFQIGLGRGATMRPQLAVAAVWPEHGSTATALGLGIDIDREITDVILLSLGVAGMYDFDGELGATAHGGLGFQF